MTHNGTKLILFGGHSANSVSTGSLYILDVHTMTWARGPNVHSAQYRSHLACTVTRDNFIAFGGIRRVDAIASTRLDATPLIYNLRKNRWVQHFTQGDLQVMPRE
ncbi:hypothetical protein BG015_001502 [Linnemannia schmuckeri]|uniref:Kelch repeat protein n=1 Tax=Linnemannia schmuckeri TaxID=64567 RepID=A0A9P5RQ77_9FUNG|nr:hypothetical protein BG015_001502 [Linnemannia schmuckeri]